MELTTHILTIDDDTTILDAYASILSPYKRTSLEDAIMKLEKLHDIDCSAIDGGEKVIDFHLHQANNGLEGVEIFRREHEAGNRIRMHRRHADAQRYRRARELRCGSKRSIRT